MDALDKLKIVYCSDIFLHNKRLRAALTLLYDQIYLPELPILRLGSNCLQNLMPAEELEQRILECDGMLGKEGIVQRISPRTHTPWHEALLFPADWVTFMRYDRLSEEERSTQDGHLEKVVAEYNLDERFFVFLRKAYERMAYSLKVADINSIYLLYCLPNFFLHAWEQTLVPRFFFADEIFLLPIAIDDVAVLLHEEILNYFIPDVGALEDEETLSLRNLTASERLGYLASVLELIGEAEEARNVWSMHEVRRILSDKIKVKVVPAFVEYLNSLKAQKKAKAVKGLDSIIQAFSVEGSITEPRYWINAAKSLSGSIRQETDDFSTLKTNRGQFMSFLAKLHKGTIPR